MAPRKKQRLIFLLRKKMKKKGVSLSHQTQRITTTSPPRLPHHLHWKTPSLCREAATALPTISICRRTTTGLRGGREFCSPSRSGETNWKAAADKCWALAKQISTLQDKEVATQHREANKERQSAEAYVGEIAEIIQQLAVEVPCYRYARVRPPGRGPTARHGHQIA
ncbi:unnamed protein product, partial [Amoebophrya sp. A120]|eukprot:GSA120T00021568001.1